MQNTLPPSPLPLVNFLLCIVSPVCNSVTMAILALVSQGTEGPWAQAFANAMAGSPDIYSEDTPPEDDW